MQPADLTLSQADREYIQAARVLHLDGQFMPSALQAARWAREAQVKVSFDGNHPRAGLAELLRLVDWLVVAETFPMAYTGNPNPGEAAEELLSVGCEVQIVTEGDRGCQVYADGNQFHVPALTVDAVDTTGAGDAFHGAFIYAMLQGWDLRRATRFSGATAALNCLTLGGRRGLPTLAQVLHALDSASTVS